VILPALALAVGASASRPVFHALTIEELVGRSAHVLVVRQGKPAVTLARLPVGPPFGKAPPFELAGLRFEVLEVLRTLPEEPVRRGDGVSAYSSNWRLEFAEHSGRVLHNRTLSYPAERYDGVESSDMEASGRYLLFLGKAISHGGLAPGFSMVPGAVERLARRPEVEEILRKAVGTGPDESVPEAPSLAPGAPKVSGLPVEWMRCRETSDCVVIAGVCGGSWAAVNRTSREEAEAAIAKTRPHVDCAQMEPGPIPKAACEEGVCAAQMPRRKPAGKP